MQDKSFKVKIFEAIQKSTKSVKLPALKYIGYTVLCIYIAMYLHIV